MKQEKCEHEFVYDEQRRQAVCKKCSHVLTVEEKHAALEYANALRRAEEADAAESGCCNFCNNQLTADELSEMVKQNGGKPVVVFVYCIDNDGKLALDCGEWGMFDGRDFVSIGCEDDLSGYGERFVAYKEPLRKGGCDIE